MYHKLPKLNLPTFGGNMLEWQPFWDSFSAAVHDNLSLNDVQKFNYLKSQLFGEATQCIAGLQITNTNYGQALHVLKQRFGQPHKIVQTYMQSLISLPSPTSNITNLKKFYDSMENYIRGLESIGESHESFGSLLVPIILNKLPGNIRENMVRAHGGDHWNLPSLRQAIQHEITIKEAGQSVNGDDMEPNYTPTSAFFMGTNRNYANQKGKRDITKKPCIFCQGVHAPLACKTVTEIEARKRIVKEKQACFNCLGNHRVADCKSDKTCKNCNKRHHTSICSKNESHLYTKSKDSSTSKPDTDAAVASMHSSTSSVRSQVLLKTAIAPITYDKTHFNTANLLFDEGAQRSFITQEIADLLNLRPQRKEAITISGFGESNKKVRNLQIATIYIKGLTNTLIPIEVLIVPQIAYPIHTYARNQSSFQHLNGLKLAHPALQDEDFEISVLVGADYYWDIVGNRVIRGSGPTAVQSKVGYLLSGPIQLNTYSNNQSTSSIMNILIPHRLEECEIHKFWEIESIGTEIDSEVKAKTDLQEMTTYQENNIHLKDNRYIAKFPWKPEHPELPCNEMIARKRAYNVINRLAKEPEMLKIYGNIINDQENRGFIEKVETPDETTNRVHYIPHHPVKKDSSTTPIRIVYDCSCRQDSESPSLNDCLSSTPPQLNKLTDILTRFRYGKYALTTDIEKAFLQIGLDEEDRDSTRFFWLRDPSNPKSELETYRFKVILFGATCSPFILNATLLKHLSTVTSATAEILKRDLYVDNVLTSVNTEEAALNFFEESRELMTNAWKYVPTDSNPADLQTRGISSTQFKESTLWMQGPSWISDENSWPTWTPQVKQETLLLTTTDDSKKTKPCKLSGISKIIDLSRFSSLKKLLRVTCYVFKFVNICKSKRPYNLRKYARHGKDITKDEIDRATRTWITDIQNEKFSNEKQQLANPSRDKNLPLVRQLRLFIDTEGVIRCAGRIHNSQLDDSAKFPVLLPKKNQFTDLVILNAHLQMLHSGAGQTITQIRQSYWIPSIRQCVNHIVQKCVKCRKVTGKAFPQQISPPLPKDRVTRPI
ncbi:uncharacterized protein LOC134727528 [Mytilus trossulus]|uniref:uncharacterized protein LOC134727528 n=1 Tax=Mytilus trossulus TaxID=6551 RepID=UPI003006DD49